MEKKEYIERGALLSELCGDDPSRMEDYYYNAIKNAPAADVVEVVRCKDCKQYEYIVYDYGRCRKTMLLIKNDDFCSYGERKNDG